jgi:hypothetical protein
VNFDVIKQIEHSHTQRIGDHLNGVESGIRLPCFDPAQIGLVKAAFFGEHHLAHSGRESKGSHARTKLKS